MTDAERTAYYDANPTSCQARHPTATDVTPATVTRNGLSYPMVGPDGKNMINRHPLKCWHSAGHEGRHGYGSVTWDDVIAPSVVHEAMMDAPHDGKPYRQARAAISARQRIRPTVAPTGAKNPE